MKKIILIFIFLFVLLIIINSIYYIIYPAHGSIIDSVTKKPIEGLMVKRVVSSCYTLSLSQANESTYIQETDQKGEFHLPWGILTKGFLNHYCRDEFYIYSNNPKYFLVNEGDGRSKPTYSPIVDLNSYIYINKSNKYQVDMELIPMAEKVEDCNNDQKCLDENGTYLAIKERDESICSNIKYSEYHDICIEAMVGLKKNRNICDKLSNYTADSIKKCHDGYYDDIKNVYLSKREEAAINSR